MADVTDSQFCDGIDRLIMEEEKLVNNGNDEKLMNNGHENESGEESSNNLKSKPEQAPSSSEPRNKNPYQRYTTEQIKQLEEVFDKMPYPNGKERKAIGQQLGLTSDRVKFWFQNRRSQTKKKNDKDVNRELKEANQKLRTDNELCKLILSSASCQKCHVSPAPVAAAARMELLRLENTLIKEEIIRVTNLVEKYYGKGVLSAGLNPTSSFAGPSEIRSVDAGARLDDIAGGASGFNDAAEE